MFEHIYFSTWSGKHDYNAEDVLADKDYSAFADTYPELTSPDSNYLIQGTFHFLLPRPYSRATQGTCRDTPGTPQDAQRTPRDAQRTPQDAQRTPQDAQRTPWDTQGTSVMKCIPDAFIHMQSFSYGKLGERYYTERKNYPSYLLLLTYQGEGLLRYEEKEYSLKKGDVFFIDCKKYHYYRTVGAEWEHSDLHLQGTFVEQFYEEYQVGRHPVFHFSNIQTYQEVLERALRIQTGSQIHWAAMASHEFENLLFLLVEQDLETPGEVRPPEAIILLRTYLEHNFRQDLSLDKMADFCGMSKYHLCREFKRYIGFSPREYMIKLRVSQAQLLLQSSAIASYKVGILCGFENEANFIRQFKKYSGTTPAKYRENFAVTKSGKGDL